MAAKEAEPVEAAQEPEDEAEKATEDAVEAEEEADEAEQPTAEEPDAAEEGPQVLTKDEYGDVLVDLNGEQVTLAKLMDGNLMQADYSRKTGELAQQRKQLEAEFQSKTKEKEAELAAREQRIAEQLAEIEEPEPDWEAIAEDDSLGWPIQKAKWDKKQKARADRIKEAEKQRDEARRQFIQQTAAVAVERMPEWADGKKFDEGASARKAAALAAGFTEQEYEQTPDFRIAILLEKAARYDAGQSSGKAKSVAAEKKIAKATKVLKPGQSSAPVDPRSERRAQFQKRLAKPVSSEDIRKMLGR